jgi:hypothetical protein
MNDPNAGKMSSKQGGFTRSLKEMFIKQRKFIFQKDPCAKKIAMYVAAVACILGIIAFGVLVLMGHSSDKGYSELYFGSPDDLPRVIYVGQGINFSFSLVSHEKTPFSYKFNVTFDGSSVKSGVVRLDPEEEQKINITLMPNVSSLVHFKTSRVAQFRTELDDSNTPVQLNVSWTPKIPMAFISPEPNSLMVRSLNSSEVVIVGSLDSIMPLDSNNISSFGYILQKGRYSTTDEKGRRYLDYMFTENEYRYKFMDILVGVLSQSEPLNGSSDQHKTAESQHSYEIRFRAIVVDDIPKKFLDN